MSVLVNMQKIAKPKNYFKLWTAAFSLGMITTWSVFSWMRRGAPIEEIDKEAVRLYHNALGADNKGELHNTVKRIDAFRHAAPDISPLEQNIETANEHILPKVPTMSKIVTNVEKVIGPEITPTATALSLQPLAYASLHTNKNNHSSPQMSTFLIIPKIISYIIESVRSF